MSSRPCSLQQTASAIIRLARERGLTICTCESISAGLISSTLASIPSASSVLAGGIVTYQTRIKEEIAHVPAQVIETYGVISPQCARAMAECTLKLFCVDIAISLTGNAGPSAMDGKPAGLVYGAIAWKGTDGLHADVLEMSLEGERNQVRLQAVRLILERLLDLLEEIKDPGL